MYLVTVNSINNHTTVNPHDKAINEIYIENPKNKGTYRKERNDFQWTFNES